MLSFIPPQLAKAAADVPAGNEWVFQEKFDGHRAQVVVEAGIVRIFSRTGLDRTPVFRTLVPVIVAEIDCDCVIDGEICAMDETGQSDFGLLCQRLGPGGPFHFKAFDLLALNGDSMLDDTTAARLLALSALLPESGPTISAAERATDGPRLLDEVRTRGGEGIVAKRLTSVYRSDLRTDDWLKIKLVLRQEFIVAGWHEDAAGILQSLVLATWSGHTLVPRGCVGSGFTQHDRRTLRAALRAIETSTAPFNRCSGIRSNVHWAAPHTVVEVKFDEITSNGSVRHPRFLGLRTDKPQGDVVLEAAS